MKQLYTRRGVMSIKNSPEGEFFMRTLLFAQEGSRAEQRNGRCGCGDAYGIPGTGGGVGLAADGEGRGGGCAVKIDRKGVGADAERFHIGGGQPFVCFAALP